MHAQPSNNIRLYGTEQPAAPPRMLKAGPLTAELDTGNLRYIRFNGVEVMRAISFIVRDKDWGTYTPEITDLEVVEDEAGFQVRYKARAFDTRQAFVYDATITGDAQGRLVFKGEGAAENKFLTNRTGFVILHPIDGVAGERVEIEHVDGQIVDGIFPELIDPIQPMMNLRRLTHWAADEGLRVDCRMEGDTFEMEDQRNWTDASYKTYVRPLALPWPYTLEKGEPIVQSITLTVSGDCSPAEDDAPVEFSVGARSGSVPALGMGLDVDDVDGTLKESETISAIGADYLVCHYDPRRGHNKSTLTAQIEAAKNIGATPWLEAVVVSVDGFEREIGDLGRMIEDLGSPFPVVLVSPAPDMKCTLPGSAWPPAPSADALYRATRNAFPGARIGGGMFSYFTELNRKRPPLGSLDLVSFTTSAMVHAGHDRSVMETLQALPSIADSVMAIAKPMPYVVGPSAIGMRGNPHGEAPKENPDNIRQAMNSNDPRQRGLFGAAWALGYFARFAYGGADKIALGSPTGATGAVATSTPFPQPYFAEHGGLYPVFHVLRTLALRKDAPLHKLFLSRPDLVQGLAVEGETGQEVWIANLTERTLRLRSEAGISAVARLGADNFVEATQNPALLDHLDKTSGEALLLGPYEILRMTLDASGN